MFILHFAVYCMKRDRQREYILSKFDILYIEMQKLTPYYANQIEKITFPGERRIVEEITQDSDSG